MLFNDDKKGGHIVINKGNGVYEAHTLSLPDGRGRNMLRLMQDARAFMFLKTNAIEIQTFVPENQSQTLLWANISGFRENFKRDKCFNYNGEMISGNYLSMSYQDWVLKDKHNLKVGQAFHAQIEKFELLTHEDDPVHDAWAGATWRSEVSTKAISYYNQWAARTGYQQVQIVNLAPVVVDIGNAIIQLNADRSFSVLKVNGLCLSEPQLVLLPEV